MTDVTFSAAGQPAVLAVASTDGAERTVRDWARCAAMAVDPGGVPGPRDPLRVTVPGDGTDDSDQYFATTSLTYLVIEALAGRRLMLHASGLSSDDGRVAALVCASGGGKSTAARTLAASALGYVTDETVVVDDARRVTPYPKPLAFVSGSTKVQRSPDELGLRPCPEDLLLHRIVVLDRRPGVPVPTVTPLPLVAGLLALIPQTSALPQLEAPLQRLASVVSACGGVHRLSYSDISDAEELVRDLLHQSPSAPVEDVRAVRPRPIPHTDEVGYRPRPWQDAVIIGDEALLMVDGVIMQLAGIGLTLWSAVVDGVPTEKLTQLVQRVHGEHPDADALVQQALTDLVAAGAIGQRP